MSNGNTLTACSNFSSISCSLIYPVLTAMHSLFIYLFFAAEPPRKTLVKKQIRERSSRKDHKIRKKRKDKKLKKPKIICIKLNNCLDTSSRTDVCKLLTQLRSDCTILLMSLHEFNCSLFILFPFHCG